MQKKINILRICMALLLEIVMESSSGGKASRG